jgi:hypothetical protein
MSLQEASDATSTNDAIAALVNFVTELKETTSEWRSHAEIVVAAKSAVLSDIVRNFRIEYPTKDAHATLKPLFVAKLISDDTLDDAIAWSHGWVKTTVDGLLQEGKVVRITKADFHAALLNYVKLHDRLIILRSFAGTPDEKDIHSELAYRCYVRQLRIIDLDDVDVLAAVNDYLRAVIDRTEWSNRGFVNEAGLDVFQAELIAMWRNKRQRTLIIHGERPVKHQGQLLYAECIEHKLSLDGLNTPDAFLRGSLHALSEDREIGWHPIYAEVLSDYERNEGGGK